GEFVDEVVDPLPAGGAGDPGEEALAGSGGRGEVGVDVGLGGFGEPADGLGGDAADRFERFDVRGPGGDAGLAGLAGLGDVAQHPGAGRVGGGGRLPHEPLEAELTPGGLVTSEPPGLLGGEGLLAADDPLYRLG